MRSQNRGGPPALPPEAAVTYTRLSDEHDTLDGTGDGRVEPHFTAVPPERKPRFEEVAAPVPRGYAEDRATIDPDEIAALDALPPRKRSRALRFVLLVGALAVLGGAGVLAATAVKVLYGGASVVAVAPPAEAPADATAIPVSAPNAPLPDSGSAGPGVLAIPSNEATQPPADGAPPLPQAAIEPPPPQQGPAPQAAASQDKVPPLKVSASASATDSAPLPHAKPATMEAALPPPAAQKPSAAAAADSDVNNLMSDVDRLLAEKKAQAAAQAATQPLPADQTVPQPLAANQTANATLDLSAEPPLPVPVTPPPYVDPNVPVPPSDIPNPGN